MSEKANLAGESIFEVERVATNYEYRQKEWTFNELIDIFGPGHTVTLLIQELRNARSQLSALTEERDTYKEQAAQLRDALDWLVTLKRIKDTEGKTEKYLRNQPKAWAHAERTLSLSPLPEREAEREVITAAEEWERALASAGIVTFPEDAALVQAVRKLRSLREG